MTVITLKFPNLETDYPTENLIKNNTCIVENLQPTFPDLAEVAGAELPDERDLGARDLVLVARGVLEGVVLGVGARLHPRRRPRQLAAQPLALRRRVAGHKVL